MLNTNVDSETQKRIIVEKEDNLGSGKGKKKREREKKSLKLI